jgi:hypothetical protein
MFLRKKPKKRPGELSSGLKTGPLLDGRECIISKKDLKI